MTLRVGIISANWGAVAHLPAWRAVPGVEVVAICTSRRETAEPAAGRLGIAKAFWDAREMMADPAIDIVDCGARPSIRQDLVVAALEAGKHVYNGIPFAADLDHARTIHQAWETGGRVGVVDAFSQCVPALARFKEMIDEGFLGDPFGGTAIFTMSLFNRPMPQFPYNWFADGSAGVSSMRNLGSHMLHVLVHCFGEIVEVTADDRRLLSEWRFPDGSVTTPETNDYANLILRFASGMSVQVQTSWSAPAGRGFCLDIFGSEGRLVVADPSFPTSRNANLMAGRVGARVLEAVDIPDRLLRPTDIGVGPDSNPQAVHAMAISMNQMARRIRGEAETTGTAPDFAQAWHVERVLEAARRSSLERRWVPVAEAI